MQITDTGLNRSSHSVEPGAVRTLATLRPGAPYDASTEPGNRLAIGRQAALRVLASEVVQALGGALGGAGKGAAGYGSSDASGVGAVAQALRAALGSADGRGDPVAALLAKLESALGDARDTLQALGADPGDIAQATAEFRDRVGGLVGASASAPEENVAALTAVSARHVRKERGSIELVTQDGDVVRIRFRSKEAERVSHVEVAAGGASASSTRVDAYSGTRIKVDVNGSLDAGELEAIRSFLGEVDQLANDFFAGDVEQAFAQGAALEFDAAEIARYSLKLSFSERTEVEGVRRIVTPPPAAITNRPTPTPAAIAPAGSVTAPAVALDPIPSPVPAAAEPPVDAEAPPAQAASPVPAPEANASSIRDTIQAFIRRVFDAADAPVSVRRFEVSWSVKIRIVAEAIEAVQPQPAEASAGGTTLLGDVLGSAADQRSTPAANSEHPES